MPAPNAAAPKPRVVITREATQGEVVALHARLVELKCRNIVFAVDTDGGTMWSCMVGGGSYRASVSINQWDPTATPLIRIEGATAAAVARVTVRLWPGALVVEHFLQLPEAQDGGETPCE